MDYILSPSSLLRPLHIQQPLSWVGHIPFAFWLINVAKPQIFVELGTHTGNSYFAFCQSLQHHHIPAQCYAVDSWVGDEHAGYYGDTVYEAVKDYNQMHYSRFSSLMRMTFDLALPYFSNGSIDMLHIDGMHSYEAVKHDFNNWLPKMSEKGIVLFHDINVRERGFGVWRLWEELSSLYPSISFDHSHGLGVLFTGKQQTPSILRLLNEWKSDESKSLVREFFAVSGDRIKLDFSSLELSRELKNREALITQLKSCTNELESRIIDLNAKTHESESRITELNAKAHESESRITELNAKTHESESRIMLLTNDYNQVVSSTIWKMTKPFRKLSNSVKKRKRKIRYALFSILANHSFTRRYLPQNDSIVDLKVLAKIWYGGGNKPKILVIDLSTPKPDQDSGSIDTFLTLKVLVELSYDVTFIPSNLQHLVKYTDDISALGVRCLNSRDMHSIEHFLSVAGKYFDVVMLYRVNVAEDHLPNVHKFAPQAKTVFNTVDLHFLRQERIAELENSSIERKKAEITKSQEFAVMRSADATIVVSSRELELIRQTDQSVKAYHLPFFRHIPGRTQPFTERRDIVFIGGFEHIPNVDAILYFIHEIWPFVRRYSSDVNLLILGSNPPETIYQAAHDDERIKVIGYVQDLGDYFNTCRISVAPLRIGAGIKGKIVTSAVYGVPCVATGLAVEGMGLTEGKEILVADEPHLFAEEILRLYSDEKLWNDISENALEFMNIHFSYEAGKKRLKRFFSALMENTQEECVAPLAATDHASGNGSYLSLIRPAETSIGNKEKIKVVVELPSFDKGGLEKMVLDSVLAFDKERFYCVIVTLGSLGHLSQKAEENGIKVVQLPEINSASAYERFLKLYRPDIAISHFSYHGYPLFKALTIPNITFIHNVYAFMSDEQRNSFIQSDPDVNVYISVSSKAAAYAVHNLGVSKEKIIVIPNGLSLSEHKQREKRKPGLTRQQFGLSDSDYVFINPASYNLHKGHYVMADALKRVLKTRNDIKILCVGNEIYPPHVQQLRKYINTSGLADHMIMPGYFNNIEDAFGICDACLMPSFIEGWSIAMNEAMFYRKPLILTDTGGASKVIENNDIGILIPNEYGLSDTLNLKTLDDLAYRPHQYKITGLVADAMLNFADNRHYWKQAGELGRQKILNSYALDDVVIQYEKLMAEVAQNN